MENWHNNITLPLIAHRQFALNPRKYPKYVKAQYVFFWVVITTSATMN